MRLTLPAAGLPGGPERKGPPDAAGICLCGFLHEGVSVAQAFVAASAGVEGIIFRVMLQGGENGG